MIASGLPDSRAISIWICFSFSTIAGVERGFVQGRRVGRGDMHRNLLAKRLIPAGHGDQNADLAHAIGRGIVDIGHNRVAFHNRHAAQGHVLADFGNRVGQHGRDGLAVQLCRCQRVHVRYGQRGRGNACHHRLEFGILGDEIGFRVHFNCHALAAIHGHGDQTFGCRAARFFWRLSPDPWCAANRWRLPCRHSFRSGPFFASIMPAPVDSRSSFTIAAVIAMSLTPEYRGYDRGHDAPLSQFHVKS